MEKKLEKKTRPVIDVRSELSYTTESSSNNATQDEVVIMDDDMIRALTSSQDTESEQGTIMTSDSRFDSSFDVDSSITFLNDILMIEGVGLRSHTRADVLNSTETTVDTTTSTAQSTSKIEVSPLVRNTESVPKPVEVTINERGNSSFGSESATTGLSLTTSKKSFPDPKTARLKSKTSTIHTEIAPSVPECSKTPTSTTVAEIEPIDSEEPILASKNTSQSAPKRKNLEENTKGAVIDGVKITTGYFSKDSRKRIDLVLVSPDDGHLHNEKSRIQFLINALLVGLEIECEPGRLEKHSHLIFIKIHAPDEVIKTYADFYNCKKFFAESRLHFIHQTWRIKNAKLPYRKLGYERDWLQLVRRDNKPFGYSNMSRSEIVHAILMHTSFSDDVNDVGLTKLLTEEAFLDAYALHDGPFRLVKGQSIQKVNARQILYHEWSLMKNVFKTQPLHLVNEYMGDRISLFFAFYGFLNMALGIAAVVGVWVALLELFDSSDAEIIKDTCNTKDKWMCPTCRDFNACPMKKFSDLCSRAKFASSLDNPFTLFFGVFISVWAILFIALWRRYENYLCWFWEIDKEMIINTVRPDYEMCAKKIYRSETTGILKPRECLNKKLLELASLAVFFIIFLVTTCLAVSLMIVFKMELTMLFRDHKFALKEFLKFAIYGIADLLLIFVLEWAFTKLTYILTLRENIRTQYKYENALVLKLYAFTVAYTFPTILFFAFGKGSFYTWPSDPSRWNTLYGVGMLNCDAYGCLDEVWVLITTMLASKQAYMYMHLKMKGYRSGKAAKLQKSTTLPIYEKEYLLEPFHIHLLIHILSNLVTQFGFSILFVAAFPLAPLCFIVVNAIQMRFISKLFVSRFRRPLLPKSPGLGVWGKIIAAVAFASALTNGLTIAWTTQTIKKYAYLSHVNKTLHGFLLWTLTEFPTSEYAATPASNVAWNNYNGFKPDKCYFPGQRHKIITDRGVDWEANHIAWTIKNDEALFIIIYEHCLLLLLLLFTTIIPSMPDDIRQARIIENRVKDDVRARRMAEKTKHL